MNTENKELIIRKPAVTGQFYPSDKGELLEIIDRFLEKVEESKTTSTPQILIVPHAGYVFSGQTAIYGFKSLAGKRYDRVFLIGNSHQAYFSGLKVDDSDVWQTPLGRVEIDKEMVKKLASENKKIQIDSSAHQFEHSLEVELPFLQRVLGTDFKLVPLLTGSDKNLADLKLIAQSLKSVIDDETLVVISTDLSHYPSYEDAKMVDKKTIDAILTKDPEKFLKIIDETESQGYENLSTSACGWPAVAVGMYLAQEMNLDGELINYTNSGDTLYGDKEKVVGYVAIEFHKSIKTLKHENKRILSEQMQTVALKLARQTLENAFNKSVLVDENYKNYDIFQERRGVFVTLRKNGQLRGCIGLIEPLEVPLGEAIQQMALSAAFNDHRFSPLTKDELDEIKIELSVLTIPRKIENVDEIELGKHGVIVKKDTHQGVFLPQVAKETGWTKEEFLGELCLQKAGLPRNCWQEPSVEFYTFEAQVFEEE